MTASPSPISAICKQVPSQAEIEALGTVNVALVPVGGGGGLNAAKAAEVVSLLEPNLVIPMHYATPDAKITLDSLNKFLKEMGLSETRSPALSQSDAQQPARRNARDCIGLSEELTRSV